MSGLQASTRRALSLHLGVLGGYTLLALVMLWPLPLHMADHVVAAKYHWDAWVNTMALGARVLNAFGEGAGGQYDSYFFAPIPDSIAFNENLFGLSLLYAPFYLASGNPLLAYNAVLLLSLALSSYFTFLLVRRLSGSFAGALIAGVAFPYCPYAFFEMGRIQLVATQWIPLTFLFLHRAVEGRKLRDLVGLGAAYALQVGTCLYYAMFLLPLLGMLAVWLFVRERPAALRFYAQLAGVTLGTAIVIGLMIFPYFTSRKNFSLTRSEEFAGNFDGQLSFFTNVAPGNRALTFLHHEPSTPVGAHEEIAFPGFTIAALALLGVLAPILVALCRLPAGQRIRVTAAMAGFVLVTGALALGASAWLHTLLAGVVVAALAFVLWLRLRPSAEAIVPPTITLYAWMLVLATLLFLGLEAFEYDGQPVRGLYYYLHTYLPGWNGIRKISRQAIMTSLLIIVLAGFGASYALSAIKPAWARALCTAVLIGLTIFEFREAPVPLQLTPAGDAVASAYRFIARQPGDAPIAMVPSNDGVKVFRGHPGGALYNYLALYHGRRTLNGKSSFVPPVTRMFNNAQARLPSATSTRILRQLGAQYVVVHTWDMQTSRANRVVHGLKADTANYRLAYRDKADYVFEILPGDRSDTLVGTPELPSGVTAIPAKDLTLDASIHPAQLRLALDGDAKTRWATRRRQRVGDWLQFSLARPRKLAALEFRDFEVVDDAPMGFEIEAAEHEGVFRTVFSRPKLRIFSDQIWQPLRFVFRVVFPTAVYAKQLRIRITDPVPGRWWSVHEASLYARD